ncbi:MAG: hypothetical protein L6V83_04090 [Christensenella sp.]|nr:MAG: hypothetical protein L6V83_04090 [Christensenella sp.]
MIGTTVLTKSSRFSFACFGTFRPTFAVWQKAHKKESVLGIVLAILVMIFGGWLVCVIDIVSLALKDKIFWIDDLNLESTNCDNNCSCCSKASDCDKKVDDQTDEGKNGTVE